ncbi:hypothetical protein [Sphingomonas agri]|uniref:hypothetical protein n=1 Tax=Sphingomonas agri TaxID=1813878 RepID=UPI00311E04E7
MRHLLMNPAFPDIVGQHANAQIDNRARAWIVERGSDGRLAERIDPDFLAVPDGREEVDEILEALIVAAAEQDISQTRLW